MSFGGFNSTSGFGSSAPSFGFGGGSLSPGFGGASSSPGFGGGGLFGSSQPSSFGAASSGTSIFGGGTGFGGGGGGGVFSGGSSSPFGNATNSTSMFGGASSSGVFGSSSPFGGNSSFGNPSSAPFGSTFTGGGFGVGQSAVNGTAQIPFSAPQESESGAHGRNAVVSYQNISSMKQYQNFSVEELREQDYKAGNKGGTGGGGGGTFGSTMGNTSVFGASSGIGGVNFGASANAFGGGMGGTSTFGQSSGQPSLFGGGGGFGTTGGPFGQSSAPSTFGASSPAFGATGGTGLFGGGTSSGFGASSGFGGFGAASSGPTGTGLFGGTNTAGGFGASSSSPSLFGGAAAGQTPNVFGGGTGFGVQSSAGAFGTSTFGSTFGAASSGGFGVGQSSGTSLFGASSGSMFGTGTTNAFGGAGASSASLFGGATTPSLFGNTSTSTNLFGASSGGGLMGANSGLGQSTGLFGATTQPAQGLAVSPGGAQPQMNWGGQNTLAVGMQQNPQNFSDLYGRIAPDLPQNGANGSQVKVGLRAMVPRIYRKKFDRKMMLATWSRDWQAERVNQAFKSIPDQGEVTWWHRKRDSNAVDIFGARPSCGEDENQEGNISDVWTHYEPKESKLIPKSIDRLLAVEEEKIEQPEDGGRPANEGGERMLTLKEIEERLPKITEEDYYIKPSIQGLTNMLRGDPNALKEVHGLVIGRKGYGKVRYEVPLNLEGVDICKCISFRRGGVTLPNTPDNKPNPLDGAVEVTIEEMYLLDKEKKPRKDEVSVEKVRNHLIKYCKAEGVQFISHEDGVWRFKADSIL